jgi:hypothetical protein
VVAVCHNCARLDGGTGGVLTKLADTSLEFWEATWQGTKGDRCRGLLAQGQIERPRKCPDKPVMVRTGAETSFEQILAALSMLQKPWQVVEGRKKAQGPRNISSEDTGENGDLLLIIQLMEYKIHKILSGLHKNQASLIIPKKVTLITQELGPGGPKTRI